MTDADALGSRCEAAVRAVGLQAVGRLVHAFGTHHGNSGTGNGDRNGSTAAGVGGVTACVLLAESHLCVHTWPERGAVTLDVYVCNVSGDHATQAHALLAALLALFDAERIERHALVRGG